MHPTNYRRPIHPSTRLPCLAAPVPPLAPSASYFPSQNPPIHPSTHATHSLYHHFYHLFPSTLNQKQPHVFETKRQLQVYQHNPSIASSRALIQHYRLFYNCVSYTFPFSLLLRRVLGMGVWLVFGKGLMGLASLDGP